MKKSRKNINTDEIRKAWFLSGFGWPQSVVISRRVRMVLQVNESLGRYTTAYIMRGEIVVDSAYCYSPEDVFRLCSRIDGRSGHLAEANK